MGFNRPVDFLGRGLGLLLTLLGLLRTLVCACGAPVCGCSTWTWRRLHHFVCSVGPVNRVEVIKMKDRGRCVIGTGRKKGDVIR